MFKQNKYVFVDIKEMNKHLAYCKKNRSIVYGSPKTIGLNAYIEDREVVFSLTYKLGSNVATYVVRKDGLGVEQSCTGMEAFKILNQYVKIPRISNPEEIGSASPFLWKNDKYEGQRVEAIAYDLNSAYSNAMLQPMPDTTHILSPGNVKQGEIGFREGELGLEAVVRGYCLYRFPLMESPFKPFIEHWYKEKKDGNKKAKGVLNFSVGYLQRVNPFIRATIITYCNNLIKSLIDENTIYCNTDSIVSLKERTDLKIGNNIGEWKVEHKGLFAFKGYNYQWDLQVPSYRGTSKNWFPPGWDILKDKIPIFGNLYELNKKTLQLEESKYEIKSIKK